MPALRIRTLGFRSAVGLVGLAIALSFPLGFLRTDRTAVGNQPVAEELNPTNLVKAHNPVQLTVMVEPGQVLGWISGVADRTGAKVVVRLNGRNEETKVEPGNTFTWDYSVNKETLAEISVGDLRQTVKLFPAVKQAPSSFFVLDRLVFRPTQTMHFAAFLRELDARSEFTPLANKEVAVQLVSEKKKATAKKWTLTTDEAGKITGEYTFTDSDPLEAYTLSIPGYKGEAHLDLAEYRKPTSQLVLTGKIDDGRLKIDFAALDFQGKPIQAQKINVTAQIVTRPREQAPSELNPADFVYALPPAANQPRPELLNDDEALLARFHHGPISIVNTAEAVVHEMKKEKKIEGPGKGDLSFEVAEKWRQRNYQAIVQAILVDASGRELRAVRTFPLDSADDSLKLSMAKSAFLVNEPINVKASTKEPGGLKGTVSLVAFRLTAAPQVVHNYGYLGAPCQSGFAGGCNSSGFGSGFGNGFGMGSHPGAFGGLQGFSSTGCDGCPSANPFPSPYLKSPNASMQKAPFTYGASPVINRKLVTAGAFRDDNVTFRIAQPGAYKLVVIWNHPDGRQSQQEIGCIVKAADLRSGLWLHLEKDSFEPNEMIKGTIRSCFADARVLLTLRDSSGLRWYKPFRLQDGKVDIKEALPRDMKYGASLEVFYADRHPSEEPPYVARRLIHVVPRDRMIAIRTKHKAVYEPGEKVSLDLQVDRKEAVDLLVGVYDSALLDLHEGRATDIRDFYLADDRMRDWQTRDLLRRKLGQVTLLSLLRRTEALLKGVPKESLDAKALQALLEGYRHRSFTVADFATLLRLAGLHARHIDASGAQPNGRIPLQKQSITLVEYLEGTYNGWKIHLSTFNDTILLAEVHPQQRPEPYPAIFNFSGGFQGGGGIQGGFAGGFGGGFGGGMGGHGFQGGFGGFVPPRMPAPALGPKAGEVIKVPGGLDTGEAFIRRDFSDLAFWSAGVKTDDAGKARVEFKLPDSLTGWRIQVTAVSKAMHVGYTTSDLQASRPVMVCPVLPRLFATGDEVVVSAIVVNRSGAKQRTAVRLDVKNGKVLTPVDQQVEIGNGREATVTWRFKAGEVGQAQLMMSASCAAGKDASLKRVPVISAGAQQVVNWSGNAKGQAELVLPEGVNPADAKLELTIAPSLAADLVDTLDYLVEYPYGCVEQTMSRFLPAVKVAQILKRNKIEHAALTAKLPGCVAAGIKRLLELQQPDGGWGWNGNGNGQTHEMMTPYALYGLIEAEKAGYAIPNAQAIPRGLDRLKKYIGSMGKAQTADRLYCMYVYALKHDLEADWWKFIFEQAEMNNLSDYATALALETAVRHVHTKLAETLAEKLRKSAIEENGLVHWTTAGFSRWGDDRFEISAAAMKALVAFDKDDPLIPKAIAFFSSTKRGNRWNSTKDTAMIVYALCDHLERQREDMPAASSVVLRCNDGEPIDVAIGAQHESKKITIPAKMLRAGKNTLRFEKAAPGIMVRASLRFVRAGKDVAALDNGLRVTRRLFLLDGNGRTLQELNPGVIVSKGAYLLSAVEGFDSSNTNMNYLLIESPLPAGAEVMPVDDKRFKVESSPFVLREEREGKVAFHHETGNSVVTDRCILHLEMAGEFVIPPARAELMYQTDKFGNSGAFSLRVE